MFIEKPEGVIAEYLKAMGLPDTLTHIELDDAEVDAEVAHATEQHGAQESEEQLQARAIARLAWKKYGMPELAEGAKEKAQEDAHKREVSAIHTHLRELTQTVAPKAQEQRDSIRTLILGVHDKLNSVGESVVEAVSDHYADTSADLHDAEQVVRIYGGAIRDGLHSIFKVLITIALLLLALCILTIRRAHAQVDVVKVQQAGTTVATFGGPFKINFSSGCTVTKSGNTANVACTGGGTGSPGGASGTWQYNNAGVFGGITTTGHDVVYASDGYFTGAYITRTPVIPNITCAGVDCSYTRLFRSELIANPTAADSNMDFTASQSDCLTTAANTFAMGSINCAIAYIEHKAPSVLTASYGLRGYSLVSGTGSITTARGTAGLVQVTNAAGSIGTAHSFEAHVLPGPGTITAGMGVWVNTPYITTGTCGTCYGLKIEDQATTGVTTAYAIYTGLGAVRFGDTVNTTAGYQVAGAALNFSHLAGNIAVGQMNSGTGASATTFWRGDGTWATPSGGAPDPLDYTSVVFNEEFLNNTGNSGSIGTYGWNITGITANPSLAFIGGFGQHIGVLRITAPSNAATPVGGGLQFASSNASSFFDFTATTNWEWQWIFRLGQTTSTKLLIGFASTNPGTNPNNFIGLRYDTATDTQFTFVSRVAGVDKQTQVVTAATVDTTTWHRIRVRSTTVGTILVSLDGGTEFAWSTVANLPTGTLTPTAWILTTAATTTPFFDLDWFAYKQTGLTRQ